MKLTSEKHRKTPYFGSGCVLSHKRSPKIISHSATQNHRKFWGRSFRFTLFLIVSVHLCDVSPKCIKSHFAIMGVLANKAHSRKIAQVGGTRYYGPNRNITVRTTILWCGTRYYVAERWRVTPASDVISPCRSHFFDS